MQRRTTLAILGLAILLGATAPVFAQGVQTGILKGTVTMPDGAPVPGVTVTVTSDKLQGSKTTTTGEGGSWLIRNLPPGDYVVTFELEGMTPVVQAAAAELGGSTNIKAEMNVAGVSEQIEVKSTLPTLLSDSQVATAIDFEGVNNLPIGRTPQEIATLSPGLTENTPNAGQVTISGGFAYDNVFLIDGVDANDNLFGTTTQVYIEDAVSDLQVLTSGISAEYGRFSGGVVNVITKSGGNDFSGTLRVDLTDDDWRNTTPLEQQNNTVLTGPTNKEYSATLGGYVLKDRLWFFLAGRDQETSETDTFFLTGLPEPNENTEDRQEYKLTANFQDKHTLQGQITDRENVGLRPSFSFSATPDTLRTRTDPADLTVGRYSGVLTPSLFAELQYSEKTFTFMNGHGLDASTVPGTQSFIENSPFFDFFGTSSSHYNAPYFDGKDPEDRNNEQLAASVSYFLDSASVGTHDLKLGFEDFTSIRTGGNSQTPTDWVIAADAVLDANGTPILGADNTYTPDWVPGASGAWQFLANREARVETTTQSFFVNDRWQLNDKWSFNLGLRYEDVSGSSQSGIVTVNNDALVPRLGLSYDPRGDGKYRFDVTYAEYAGKYSESQFAQNTDVGNPPGLLYIYVGDPGTGYDFAPGYDFNNELGDNYITLLACDGTQNVFVADNISSPTVDEITLGAGMELARGGFLKAVYTNREYNDLVEDFVDTTTGTTEVIVQGVSAGTFSNTFITNSNDISREYEALQLIGRYRLNDKITIDGNWTYQLKNDGNFEGEGTNTPGSSSDFGDYPEIRDNAIHHPVGPLNDFAEHKLRVWTNYNLDMGRAGNLNFGLLANYDSGRTFSRFDTEPIFPTQEAILEAAGYVDAPADQDLFFGGRGGVTFDDAIFFDLSLNYQLPIYKDFQLWLKADIFNVFDDDTQTAGRSNVNAVREVDGGPVNSLGIPTTFTEPGNFRSARNNADFVDPQEYRFTVGFRF